MTFGKGPPSSLSKWINAQIGWVEEMGADRQIGPIDFIEQRPSNHLFPAMQVYRIRIGGE